MNVIYIHFLTNNKKNLESLPYYLHKITSELNEITPILKVSLVIFSCAKKRVKKRVFCTRVELLTKLNSVNLAHTQEQYYLISELA